MAGVGSITVNIKVQPMPRGIDLKALSPKARLSLSLSKPPKKDRMVFFRPTTAALRRALHHGGMIREHRCQVYQWLLTRRHQSQARSRG